MLMIYLLVRKQYLVFFADDTALLIDSNNATESQTLTNTDLANINQWMKANNLVVNANKTIVLKISPNMRNNKDTPSYVLNGETVCSSNFTKYLAITMDNNQLSFETHINNLESKVACSVGAILKLGYLLSSTQYFIKFILFSCSLPFPLCFACLGFHTQTVFNKIAKATKQSIA